MFFNATETSSYIQNASGFGKDLSFVLQLIFNHQQGETLSNPFYTQVKSGKQTLDNTPPQFSIHVVRPLIKYKIRLQLFDDGSRVLLADSEPGFERYYRCSAINANNGDGTDKSRFLEDHLIHSSVNSLGTGGLKRSSLF
ncbi:hypothetical protein DPMN_132407 [Dreissena polymorpha]|uniref:Uncharacterized protein n=1 Tax=Dreissena polymorpha TaxID=45954 RepID=A0A9D4JA26_DREPO|nr:hypothetical protein DPMN_132407 [Dreissena polymorpha]